jgi:hypothetical protein
VVHLLRGFPWFTALVACCGSTLSFHDHLGSEAQSNTAHPSTRKYARYAKETGTVASIDAPTARRI